MRQREETGNWTEKQTEGQMETERQTESLKIIRL